MNHHLKSPKWWLKISYYWTSCLKIGVFWIVIVTIHCYNLNGVLLILYKELNKLELEYASIKLDREREIAQYFNLRQQIESLRNQMASIIAQPKNLLNFLNPGRLVHVVNKNDNYGWGVVINFRKRPSNKMVYFLPPNIESRNFL